MKHKNSYVIGVDFGTASVRTIVVNALNGQHVATAECEYPRWKANQYNDASKNQFRQHPLDYIESFEHALKQTLLQLDANVKEHIKAISIDTTGSTPIAVDAKGVPLAMHEPFKDNPNAMFWLWKDHTAIQAAADINAHAKTMPTNYLKYVGGIYSSEWFWAKLLHLSRTDNAVWDACYTWVEHCDWFPFLLTGGQNADDIKRGVCAAGHKGLWSDEWGGLPPDTFFSSLDSKLSGFTDHAHKAVYTADQSAGTLCVLWAKRFGLSTNIKVGIGAIDAHFGAVGGQIEPYYMSKVMGTSTCDMLVIPPDQVNDTVIDGICGQIDGSIVPQMIGMEAGQSAFGDAYHWFKDILVWPIKNLKSNALSQDIIQNIEDDILESLNIAAEKINIDLSTELALDWLNGRRTPDANQSLKGAILDIDLGTDAPKIFRAIAEATCFGAKKIVERFQNRGIPIKGIVGIGGVAQKSPFVMQMMSDVLNMPIKIHRSDQTCAYGAAMFAATVAGIYPKVELAMAQMGQGFSKEYQPNPAMTGIYSKRYKKYNHLAAYIESNA